MKVASIIAVRLKSERFLEKAKRKIGNYSSIEFCIKNTLKIKESNLTILATSSNEQDAELSNYLYDSSKVIFHKGDADDVVDRYLKAIEKYKIDVFFRITGDTPFVSSDIATYLFQRHLDSGADYTVGKSATIGTNLEIINSEALRKVKKYFPSANYSEYMTWYFQNNPEYFDLNFVDLPKKWVRDYRLTLDYQEDLELFNQIENHFVSNKIEYSIDKLYEFLDANPELSKINKHITQAYQTDQKLIDILNRVTKINLD